MAVGKFDLWDLEGPDKLWQLAVLGTAEALGTGTLVFIGCSGALPFDGFEPSLFYIAAAFGFGITIAVMAIGHISGAHINPGISLAAFILGKLSPITFLVYVAFQCLGAIVGMQSVLVAASNNITAGFCVNQLSPNISPFKGVFIEAVLTGILVLLVCSVWDPRNSTKHDSAPIKFGVSVMALVMAGAKFTGCSMNPARSFAPTILSGNWKNHWVYWVGPLSGSVVMAVLYKFWYLKSYLDSKKVTNDEPESEPLARKNNITIQRKNSASKEKFVVVTS